MIVKKILITMMKFVDEWWMKDEDESIVIYKV